MEESFDLLDPRVEGVREQHERVKWFCVIAKESKDPVGQFRLLIAAVYFARAVVELILDAADAQALREFRSDVKGESRKSCEAQLAPILPHYHLIERIRIHDFHRFGCKPPDPGRREVFFGGPMKLTASKGAAVLAIPSSGPNVTLTGNSSQKDQRSLCTIDGAFFDHLSAKYLPLQQILSEYLAKLPESINWFEKKIAGQFDPP